MKIFFTLAIVFCSLFCTAQNKSDPLQLGIDSMFNVYSRPGSPGVAVLILKNGKVLFEKNYGMANLDYDIPITSSTVFDIASVSKQFTGFAISTLIQEGKISPDDDIHKYLPDLPQFEKPITIANLVHHTSGLRDWPEALHAAGWRWGEDITYNDIMRMIRQQHELDFEPGTKYSYSNTGYNVLAALVAKVSGETFPKWIDEHIFKPLKMNASMVMSDYTKVVKNLASSYSPSGKEFSKSNDELIAYGSSSILTTTEDLAKWVNNFQQKLDEKDPVYLRMIETGILNDKKKIDYAYGLNVYGNYNNTGLRNISHDGGWAGFATIISNYPDQKLSIILLSNTNGFDPYGSANAIRNLVLNVKTKPAQKREDLSALPNVKVDTMQLKKYTGTYQLGEGWYVTFTLENSQLMAQANGEPKFSTDLKSDTVIWVPDYGSSVIFREINDKANAIKYHGIIAKRITPVTLSVSQLQQYAGTYYSRELESSYKLTVENGKLLAHNMRLGNFNIMPDMKIADRFSSSNGTINFYKDSQGHIAGYRLSGGRVQNILFEKM